MQIYLFDYDVLVHNNKCAPFKTMADANEAEEEKGGGSSIRNVMTDTKHKSDGANSSRAVLKLVNEGLHAGTNLVGQAANLASNPIRKNKRSAADPSSSAYTESDASCAQTEELGRTPSCSLNPSVGAIATHASSKDSSPATKSAESEPSQTPTITLGPACEFLFRDSTLLVITALLAVATCLVKDGWLSLSDGSVPTQVCVSLVVLAFLLGRETAKLHIRKESMMATNKTTSPKVVSFDEKPTNIGSSGGTQGMQTHAFFRSLCGNLAKANIKFGPRFGMRMSKNEIQTSIRSSLQKMPSGRTPKPFWKENLDRSSDLMQSMLKNPKFKRSGKRSTVLHSSRNDDKDEDEVKISEVSGLSGAEVKRNIDGRGSVQLGPIDFGRAKTTKRKGDEIIEPLFHLRGVDIFLTTDGNPQEKIWQLEALKGVGLRSKPTFCINCLLPWSNFVAYFAMPNWFVDTTSSLEVKEGDTPDEIALKRFLKASSEQKTKQFSLRPCLIDGPIPIRMMASPGEEYEVGHESIPMEWYLDEGRGDEAPLLGLDVDCTSDKALRTAASLAKRYLYSVSIDVGVVIEDEDLACCLGLFRMDKIDTKICPELPERTAEEDLHRASTIMFNSSKTRPEA